MGEEGDACFICLNADNTLLKNICACKTLAVHHNCLQKLLEARVDPLCGVCKQPYKNVMIVFNRKVHRSNVAILCIDAVNSCICLTCAAYMFFLSHEVEWAFAVALGFVTSSVAFVTHGVLYARQHRLTILSPEIRILKNI